MNASTQEAKPILVLGGTGKTGRRVVQRLTARELAIRVGSRAGEPPFDWEDRATWAPALFSEVVDGRNAATTDGVRQALGREPRDFADYVRNAAATGVWDSATVAA